MSQTTEFLTSSTTTLENLSYVPNNIFTLTMPLNFKKNHPDAILPSRAHEFDAGLDLSSVENVSIPGKSRATIDTGISVAIPTGSYGRIAPRSGLAHKFGIDVLAGVLDSAYRGNIKVILYNTGDESFTVNVGDRIAQLVIERIINGIPKFVDDLDSTIRAENGFGSSGIC